NISALSINGNIQEISIRNNDILNNLWGLQNITSIDDHLYISNNSNLIDLQPLNNLNTVGYITIQGNSQLSSLSGLEGLIHSDGRLTIEDNDNLINLLGLDNLIFAAQLYITNNFSLQTLQGLENINVTGDINLTSNYHLENIEALSNITNLSVLQIRSCNNLSSLSGLENLTEISGNLEIGSNSNLVNLSGLSNLTIIGSTFKIYFMPIVDFSDLNLTYIGSQLFIDTNSNLQSLIGLENIDSSDIIRLKINGNRYLTNCAIQSICDYIEIPANNVEIYDNDTNCNSRQEVQDACILGNEDYQLSELKIYPNPTKGTFGISGLKEGTIKIIDSQGRTVKELISGEDVYSISELSSGIYFVKI